MFLGAVPDARTARSWDDGVVQERGGGRALAGVAVAAWLLAAAGYVYTVVIHARLGGGRDDVGRHAVAAGDAYRGLDPHSALFLTEGGKPFRIRARSPDDPRPTCPVLLATFAGIFRRAGWRGVNTQHVRRLFAQRVASKGADKEQLGALLGLTSKRAVKRLLERRPRPLADLVKELV